MRLGECLGVAAINQRDAIIHSSLLSLVKELQVEENSRTHRRRHQR